VGDDAERLTRRYLDLLRGALLDEHYLENELRIRHLLECVEAGRPADPRKLADPARAMAKDLRRLQAERRSGELAIGRARDGERDGFAYTSLGRARLDHLEACVAAIATDNLPGDLVDCGTARGGAAIFMRGLLEANGLHEPRVWVADRFDGGGDRPTEDPSASSNLNAVREGFARFSLLDDRVVFLQGEPAVTLRDAPIDAIALLRVDGRQPERIAAVLDAVIDRVVPGGFVIVDHYGLAAAQQAVELVRAERGMSNQLEQVDWGASAWRTPDKRPTAQADDALSPPTTGTAEKDLSVVVVVHDMLREARRTLHSLSRSYQQGLEDLDYEVLVVENGSSPEQRLGEDFVRSHGDGFRYLDLGDDSAPSPARAVNRGIAEAAGRAVALMIDGAHVLTPGVLRYGMLGLATYAPAFVTTRQWYVGPGQQPLVVAGGYDTEREDRLFEQIQWPRDGYRLFDVGHFIGDRDWFDGEWESNCIFVPRELLDQIGAMDESFSTPGGGFVNLDLFERLVAAPGVTHVTILGEGSFHQVHGGTTTNLAVPERRSALIRSYEEQYAELRGRRFKIPPQQAHYVGSLPESARRTKARRMTSREDFQAGRLHPADARPPQPEPMPEDLQTEFIDAFWRSGEWHHASWLGRPTHRAPTDLFVYQELIFRVRPDWIVETRTGAGGRAMFLASVCDLVGSGRVLSIDPQALDHRPRHPRITYLQATASAAETADEVRALVGDAPKALVVLGADAGPQVAAAFRNLAPVVPVGSYVVVEDTILGGFPVWPGFGPGPAGAAQQIADEGDFVPDRSLERYGLTFNRAGFLKRVR
jgi:cephalosporin hydroxylase